MPEIPLREVYAIKSPLVEIGLSPAGCRAVLDAPVPDVGLLVDQRVTVSAADYRRLRQHASAVTASETKPMRRRAPFRPDSQRYRIVQHLSRYGAHDPGTLAAVLDLPRRVVVDVLRRLLLDDGYVDRVPDQPRRALWHITMEGREALLLTDRLTAEMEDR